MLFIFNTQLIVSLANEGVPKIFISCEEYDWNSLSRMKTLKAPAPDISERSIAEKRSSA